MREKDRYGRWIGLVVLKDSQIANYRQVQQGLCWHYVHFAGNDTVLAALQTEAQAAKRGLWTDPNPVPPWEFRKAKHVAR